MSPRRILITGGAGFVGCHLAAYLAGEEANEVTIVDDFSRARADAEVNGLAARPNVRLVTADLTDAGSFAGLGDGYADVYHLAAVIGVRNVLERPEQVVRINALATLNLLEWFVAGGGEKLLFSSTSEAYAWTQLFHPLPIPTPEDCPLSLTNLSDPRSSYAGSKIFGELAITHWCRAHGKPFVIVRYHNVYGPRMGMEHVIPELFARALAGQDPLVVYSPKHRRAFCYVSDAVEATANAMRLSDTDGQTINIGNDSEELSIEDLAGRVLERAGLQRALSPRAAANDPVRRRCPDLSRARELLGYEPRVALREGLDLTLAWYANRLENGRRPTSYQSRRPAARKRFTAERSGQE